MNQSQSYKNILQSGSWKPENRVALEELILTYGKHSSSYDPANKPLAVFDWDHTCIAGDIGNSTFYYIIDNLLFKFDLDHFRALIPEKFYRDEILDCYRRIIELPLEKAKLTAEYKAYRTLLIKASDRIVREYGVLAVCAWMVKLLKGLSVSEVRKFTEQALEQELKRPIGKIEIETYHRSDSTFSISSISKGSTRVYTGIRFYEEVKDLIKQFQIHGFEVWVVSASCKWIVDTIADEYGIPSNRVIGITARIANSAGTEIITGEILNPTPVEAGKVEAIKHFIKKRPIFVAGDTIHDLPMLRYSRQLRLVIERQEEPTLKEVALQNGWLIQPEFISK